MSTEIRIGDMRAILPTLAADSIDSIVTDPPYELGFMGKAWDRSGVTYDPATWQAAYRVLKPGAHLLAFGGTRTFHRLAVALEDAGLEIRDTLSWLYGSGFPKSLDVSKAIDKAAGATRETIREGKAVRRMIQGADQNATGSWIKDNGREYVPTETAPATAEAEQWAGWGTALKPAWEPIIVARKPLIGTVAATVLAHGTGALNIEACRIKHASDEDLAVSLSKNPGRADLVTSGTFGANRPQQSVNTSGRWPANVALDEDAAAMLGDPARFFYTAKASRAERGARNDHPTVKPIALMQWLVRLVTPPGGTVLDPFLGSGSTGIAAHREGFGFIGIELSAEYAEIARRRMSGDAPLLNTITTDFAID